MRVPAHQGAEAQQKGRAAGPDGGSLRPMRSQGHKKATAWNNANCSGPQVLDLAGEAAMDSNYFPEKKPNTDVAKVTVSGRWRFLCVSKKNLTANKK
jgi:hypothetical protein